MKKKDIIIIAAVLAAALALFGVSQIAGGREASTVVVTVEGREVLRRPLAMSKTIVCLPHKLVVRLEGDSAPDGQDDLDVIIQ